MDKMITRDLVILEMKKNKRPISVATLWKATGKSVRSTEIAISQLMDKNILQIVAIKVGRDGKLYDFVSDEYLEITSDEIEKFLDRPIWDDVLKKWIMIYRDDEDMYWIQQTRNNSEKFQYQPKRFYADKIEHEEN